MNWEPLELPKAMIITEGLLAHSDAKTAHGLIRGTERFSIVAVIDSVHAGKDAGEVLDGKNRNIPVFKNIEEAIESIDQIAYLIIGVATVGGVLPISFEPTIATALKAGISIVNGLHEYLSVNPKWISLAESHQAELIDVRKPKEKKDLHFWTGKIFQTQTPIVAVIGMDCAMGKRTTCRLLREACNAVGLSTSMIYTGQTGWLQGGKYGFIFDATLNDFISGELEHSILSCIENENPQLILLEGQSALRNPSGPCGAELLISGNAKHTILVAAPKRKYYEDDPSWGEIPSIASEIDLIKIYGSKVIAIALNTEHCSLEEALQYQEKISKELGLPVLLPLEQGVQSLVPILKSISQSA